MFESEITRTRISAHEELLAVLQRHGHHLDHAPHPVTKARRSLINAAARLRELRLDRPQSATRRAAIGTRLYH